MQGQAEKLARGAQGASYTSVMKSPLGYDISLGLSEEEICRKWNLLEEDYQTVLSLYMSGDDAALSHYVTKQETQELEQEEVVVQPIVIPEPVKSEYGYKARPRTDHIFVRRAAKEHSSALIIPDAYKENSDVGFIVNVGPQITDLKAGDLVLFDKYATVGTEVNLIDEEGDEVAMLLLRGINVQAILQRIKRDEFKAI
jgi:co-chaperonin GroES (HSP10)